MSEAVADEPLSHSLGALRDSRVGLAVGLAALALMFHTEIEAAVRTWIDSTAYNHCFLVIPIALYLIWDRRGSLRGLTAVPMPIVALLTLPLSVVWLTAERLGIMEGRQLVAVTAVEVLFLALFGWRLWRALSGPLLYLYFLVPFGGFLTPYLQDVTTWFTRHGLDLLGIPAYIDGYIIEIPEGTFFVAEACAGLRFLIASIAFGTLYALLMYRSPGRRALFVLASLVTPIIANGIRAMGIVVLGHILGSAEAAAADHVLYGWIFFSLVILLLIVIGLPFREDGLSDEPADPPMVPEADAARHGLVAAVAVSVLAAIGPGIALLLNQAAAAPEMAVRPLDLSPVCTGVAPRDAPAGTPGRLIEATMTCGGMKLLARIEVFSPHSTAGPINAERRRLTRRPEADDLTEAPLTVASGQTLRPWRVIIANEPAFITAAGVWIGGEPMVPGMAMRLRMAGTSVLGDAYAPVLVVVTPIEDWAHVDTLQKKKLEAQLAAILASRPDIGEQIRAIATAVR